MVQRPRSKTPRLILQAAHRPVLAQFAASNVLLAFDFDGTLAPIVPTPSAARMRPETRRLLGQVARAYPCVVISGRRLAELKQRFQRIPVWHLVGDHGFEPLGTPAGPLPHVRRWVNELRNRLPSGQGLVIEPKKNTVTVHYRQARDKRRMLKLITEAVRHLEDVRAVNGEEAVNLLRGGGPDKGVALQEARKVFACDTAIYIGDDATDEDAFTSAPADRLLSIRVGTRKPSKARYRLRNQLEMDRFLETLLTLRE